MRTHSDLDQRSLAMHRLVVAKIRRDPAWFEYARRTLARWRRSGPVASQPYLERWQLAFDRGVDAALELAVEASEDAPALRQCSPFDGILSTEERLGFLKSWSTSRAA